jgi:hypothetical protein
MLHLAEKHGVAEMEVGRGGIETGFDAQRTALLRTEGKALLQVLLADDFGKAFAEIYELFVDSYGQFLILPGQAGWC